jgi:hypothetical protein
MHLRVRCILECVEDLLQSHHLPAAPLSCLPHDPIRALAELLSQLKFARDVPIDLIEIGHHGNLASAGEVARLCSTALRRASSVLLRDAFGFCARVAGVCAHQNRRLG